MNWLTVRCAAAPGVQGKQKCTADFGLDTEKGDEGESKVTRF